MEDRNDIGGFITARLAEKETHAWEFHNVHECDQAFPCQCGYEARALREVAALRRIVDLYNSLDSVPVTEADLYYANGQASGVVAVASIWADHPDYRPEWAL